MRANVMWCICSLASVNFIHSHVTIHGHIKNRKILMRSNATFTLIWSTSLNCNKRLWPRTTNFDTKIDAGAPRLVGVSTRPLEKFKEKFCHQSNWRLLHRSTILCFIDYYSTLILIGLGDPNYWITKITLTLRN